MKKRVLRKVAVALSLSSGLFAATIASASENWSSNMGWTSAEGSYSPYWGNTAFREYKDTTTHFIEPNVRFHFNSSAITSIKNNYNNGHNYGMDISVPDDYNTTVNADITKLWSDLPNPHFDVDDDGNNWYNDESEVTSLAPDQIVAETDYRFRSNFKEARSATTTFNFTSNVSWYFSPSGEWQTAAYDTHVSRSYTTIF